MDKILLKNTILDQKNIFQNKKGFIKRKYTRQFLDSKKISVISGVRRSGKSTLLKIISDSFKNVSYLNFDDERLLDFSYNNFNDLLEQFYEINGKDNFVFMFDEIQNIYGWEKFVSRLYSQGKKVFITGSNSKLLSSELASSLTGRYVKLNLFPFSFYEFLLYKKFDTKEDLTTENKAIYKKMFSVYMHYGGFPEVIISKDEEELKQLYQDVLIKDLIVRFKIKEVRSFRELAFYLLSNITAKYSLTKLQAIINVKSQMTVKNYIDYLQESFLFFNVSKYDYSVKKQLTHNKKIYTIDSGLFNAVSFGFSGNEGKILENAVFLELLRRGEEIYYYQNIGECDFILNKKNKITEAIQVTLSIFNKQVYDREINGLLEAMNKFNLKRGMILSYDDEKVIMVDNKTIDVIPVWKWLLSE